MSDIFPSVGDIVNGVKKAVSGAIDDAISGLQASVDSIAGKVKDAIVDTFGNPFDDIDKIIKQIVKSITDTVTSASNFVGDVTQGIKDQASQLTSSIKSVVSDAISTTKSGIQDAINGIKGGITDTINGAKDSIRYAVDGISDGINQTINQVKDAFNRAIADSKEAYRQISEGIKYGVDQIVSGATQSLKDAERALIEPVKQSIQQVKESINSTINAFGDKIDATIKSIRDTANSIYNGIIETVNKEVEAVKRGFDLVVSETRTFIANTINTASTFVQDTIKALQQDINAIIATIQAKLTEYYNFVTTTYQKIDSDLRSWYNETFSKVAAQSEFAAKHLQDIGRKLLTCGYGSVDELAADISFTGIDSGVIKMFLSSIVATIALVGAAPVAAGPYLQCIANLARADARSTNIDAGTVGELVARGIWSSGEAGGAFARLGLPDNYGAGYINAAYQALPPEVLVKAHIRGLINYDTAVAGAVYAGIRPDDFNLLFRAYFPILSPGDAIAAYFKGAISYDTMGVNLREAGYQEDQIAALLAVQASNIAPGTLQQAYLRGIITEDEHTAKYKAYGFNDRDIDVFKQIYQIIPPVQDLVRFMVREVFTPEIAEKYGQFEDFPEAMKQWGPKLGLSEYWQKAYWAAHWELPSPQQGFEMFQRGIITYDDLRQLLRSLDVMPYWREKLIQINFNPLTRVDVRRMYQLGILDKAQVTKAYKDIGYNDANARALTEFTVRYTEEAAKSDADKVRELSQSTILQAYSRGLLDYDAALEQLQQLKYEKEDAELILSIQDYNKTVSANPDRTGDLNDKAAKLIIKSYTRRSLSHQEATELLTDHGYTEVEAKVVLDEADFEYTVAYRDQIASTVREMYIERTIDYNAAQAYLVANGFTDTEVKALFSQWLFFREARTKKLSETDLKKAFKYAIIDKDTFIDELRGLGYAEQYIPIIVALNS